MQIKRFAIAAALLVAAALPLSAQTTVSMGAGGGGSPHQKTTWTVNGATISIEYGRPYLKGRADSVMMPAGTPWRTGADQASVITSDKPLTFGKVVLAPGSYTINTEPGADGWQLILGTLASPGQWGIPYQPKLEIGRAPMTLGRTTAPVEQVTFSIDPGPTPTLRVEWGRVSATVPFRVGS
ncbi:MAG: DUF2911 domain-containing protein [Gemmatimonadaceae bacterium]